MLYYTDDIGITAAAKSIPRNKKKQAGAELGQAQPRLGLQFC